MGAAPRRGRGEGEVTKVENVKCFRYHRGVDGLGTCDDGCQWFVSGAECPYWYITEAEWKARESGVIYAETE